MEAGSITPLSYVRRYVMENRVDRYPYSDERDVETMAKGDWMFRGRRGLVLKEYEHEPYVAHSWKGTGWFGHYDHLAPLPDSYRTRTKVIFATPITHSPTQYVPLNPLTTTAWNGRSPLHYIARNPKLKIPIETVLKSATDEEKEVMFAAVDNAGRTPLHLAVESLNGGFIIEVFEKLDVQNILGPRGVKEIVKKTISGGLVDTVRWMVEHIDIGVVSTKDLGNSGKAEVVRIAGDHAAWGDTGCLDVFLSPGRVSVEVLKVVFSYPESVIEVERKADWKAVGSSLVAHRAHDVLGYLLGLPAVRSVLIQRSLQMAHLVINQTPPQIPLLRHLLSSGAVRSPGIGKTYRYTNESHRKSVLALAMDRLDANPALLETVLEYLTVDDLTSACVLFYGNRKVYTIPPLAYAAVIGSLPAAEMLLKKYAELGIPPTEYPKVVVHMSNQPWMSQPILFKAEPPDIFPDDVWRQVITFLPARELAICEMTCRGLHDIIADGEYWTAALMSLKKIAAERSPHYAKIKLKGREPLPDPETVIAPKHVIQHAVSKGVFLCNCNCVVPADVTSLCKAESIPGYTTRALKGITGYFALNKTGLFSMPRRWGDEPSITKLLLMLYDIDDGGHTEILHTRATVYPLGDYKINGLRRSMTARVFVHPLVEILKVGGCIEGTTRRCTDLLRKESPGEYFGHYYKVDDPNDTDEDEWIVERWLGEGQLGVSLLAVSLRYPDMDLVKEAWRVSKKSYRQDPSRYTDLLNNSPLAEAVRVNNHAATQFFLMETPDYTPCILTTALRYASEEILVTLLGEIVSQPGLQARDTILSLAVLRSSEIGKLFMSYKELFPKMDYEKTLEVACMLGRKDFLETFPKAILNSRRKYYEAAAAGRHSFIGDMFTPDLPDDEVNDEQRSPEYVVMALPCDDCVRPHTANIQCAAMSATYNVNGVWAVEQYEVLIRSLIGVEIDGYNAVPRERSVLWEDTPRPVYLADGRTTTSDLFEMLMCRGHEHIHRLTRYPTPSWHRVFVKGLRKYTNTPATSPIVIIREFQIVNNGRMMKIPVVCKAYHPKPYAPVRFAQVIISKGTASVAREDPSVLTFEARRFVEAWDLSGKDDRDISIWVFVTPPEDASEEAEVLEYKVSYIAVPATVRDVPINPINQVVPSVVRSNACPSSDESSLCSSSSQGTRPAKGVSEGRKMSEQALEVCPVEETAFRKPAAVFYRSEWEVPQGEDIRTYTLHPLDPYEDGGPSPSYRGPPASPASPTFLAVPPIRVSVMQKMTSAVFAEK
eukprot:TRINITY_DN17531_c0_g1_i1.p1 TRINITY_DN17531_c0_g1~~TRINITY_DN17531_c0_g1_i1.p1  ORF type:complete len:1342 (+),score=143.56 TRINITY_DN17531_c0_g1_i1:199-4026(+)